MTLQIDVDSDELVKTSKQIAELKIERNTNAQDIEAKRKRNSEIDDLLNNLSRKVASLTSAYTYGRVEKPKEETSSVGTPRVIQMSIEEATKRFGPVVYKHSAFLLRQKHIEWVESLPYVDRPTAIRQFQAYGYKFESARNMWRGVCHYCLDHGWTKNENGQFVKPKDAKIEVGVSTKAQETAFLGQIKKV